MDRTPPTPLSLKSLAQELLTYMTDFLPERQMKNVALAHRSLSAAVRGRPKVTQRCKQRSRNIEGFKSHMSPIRRELNLSGCLSLPEEPVRTQQLEVLREWITIGLIQLDLSFNQLNNQDVNRLGLQLGLTGLTSIDVGFNNLDEEAALGIVRAARQQDKLMFLGLARCNINPTGAKEIAEYVSVTARLTRLDLSHNFLDAEAGKALAGALSVNGVLKSIDLSFNELCGIDEDGDGTYDASGIQALASALAGNRVLTNLNLAANNLTNYGKDMSGIQALASALAGNGVLKSIDLRNNNLGTEGWCAIFHALRDNKDNKIESWDLSNQGMNAEIAKALAEYVSVSRVLTSLNLTDNALCGIKYGRGTYDPSGIQALASALAGNAVLTTLHLSFNHIGAEGAKALASALAGSAALTNLDARFNSLGDEAKMVLRDAAEGREGFQLLV